jgi:Sec-independent protein translocase protein TatA
VFNLGLGEVTVLVLLAIIFLGPARLPDLSRALVRTTRGRRRREAQDDAPPWTWSDWLLVGAVAVLAIAALALADQ